MKQLIYRAKRYYHFAKTGIPGLIAAAREGHPERQLKIIMITGTDGKTTTSSLIYHLLHHAGYKVGLLSTVAAYIGDKTLDTGFHTTTPSPTDLYRYLHQMVDAGMEYCVLEMTSQGAYQWRGIGIHATVSGLTNVDHDHWDYHLNFDNYLQAKTLVLNAADTAVVADDTEYFHQIKRLLKPTVNLVTYSKTTRFSAPLEKAIRDRFSEDYNRANAYLAITICKHLGVNEKTLQTNIATFKLPEGRLEIIPTKLNFTMIVDFAHTPQALAAVLPAIHKQYLTGKNQLIGIVGCAGLRDHTKRPQMGKLMAQYCDVAIFTSEDPRTENIWSIIQQMKSEISPHQAKVVSIPNREKALRFALEHYAHDGNVIAIFGKGHEKSMNYDGHTETLWCDRDGARNIIAELESHVHDTDNN